MTDASTAAADKPCPYCAMTHFGDVKCPLVSAIEYHLDGTVKRVEFHPPSLLASVYSLPIPAPTWHVAPWPSGWPVMT